MPTMIDLFSGAGGAAVGYHRAGWEVIGVDIEPQPRYPFEFHRADWLEFLDSRNWKADAIHASPVCKGYSRMNRAVRADHPLLIGEVRTRLQATGLPYVIENVEGAPLIEPWMLCGTQFGLRTRRHRLFEVHPPIFDLLPPCWCAGRVASGELVGQMLAGKVAPGRKPRPELPESARLEAYGVPWMKPREARDAVPPPYTAHIGRLLRESLSIQKCR